MVYLIKEIMVFSFLFIVASTGSLPTFRLILPVEAANFSLFCSDDATEMIVYYIVMFVIITYTY